MNKLDLFGLIFKSVLVVENVLGAGGGAKKKKAALGLVQDSVAALAGQYGYAVDPAMLDHAPNMIDTAVSVLNKNAMIPKPKAAAAPKVAKKK